MSNLTFGLVVFFTFIIIVGIAINNNIRYKCVEGNCIMTNEGEYSSKSECESVCNKVPDNVVKAIETSKKKVQFDIPKDESVVEGTEEDIVNEERDTSYICDNEYRCVEVQGKNTGPFTSLDACVSNCKQTYPSTYGYPSTYFYPQSLIYHNRPYYWSPNRNRHRHYLHRL